MFDASDSKRVFDLIPEDVVILVCHGPPFGILDKTSRDINVGDKYLLKKVMDIKPKLMVFGHVHGAFGMVKQNDVTFINAAQYDGIKKKNKTITPKEFVFYH